MARRTNPAANDVCCALFEGGSTVRSKQDPEYSFCANQLLSYRIPVPKAGPGLPPGLLSIDHNLGHGIPPGYSMEEPSPPEVVAKFADVPVPEVKIRDLWDALEEALDVNRPKGTNTRFILVEKDAPRDATGQFPRDTIPSDKVTEGPVFDICKRLAPNFRFNTVHVNKFLHHKQCQKHRDRKNVGNSLFASWGTVESVGFGWKMVEGSE